MMMVRTYVAPSGVEGLGVYAEQDIEAGAVIWRLEPKFTVTFTPAELAALPEHMQEYVRRYAFPDFETAGNLIVETDNGRFMNHSDDPNVDFTVYEFATARRAIKAGEELLGDYREFDPDFAGNFARFQHLERHHVAD